MPPRKVRGAAAHSAGDSPRVDQVSGQIGANAIAEKPQTQATHRHPNGIGTMPISAIILGKRHRRDMGDIEKPAPGWTVWGNEIPRSQFREPAA